MTCKPLKALQRYMLESFLMNIENACQTINPGILIIQPHAGCSKNNDASKPSNNSPAKILPYKRRPKS